MLFQDLFPQFDNMEYDSRLSFMARYREQRTEDLQKSLVVLTQPKSTKRAAKKDKTIKLTKDQVELLRTLGLI